MIQQTLAIVLMIAVLALMAACGAEEQVSPTATPETGAKLIPGLDPQTQPFMLRISSPDVNLVTDSDQVSVSGVVTPDATVSVNGRLVLPDAQGRFSLTLDRPKSGSPNPMAIEVVATSITGEYETQVLPVIYSNGSGIFGAVTAATSSEITILTDASPVDLAVDAATTVRIHGWETPSVANLASGTAVAVLTEGSRAVSIYAVPGRPVLTRHFTGLVLEPDSISSGSGGSGSAGNLTLRDDSGRQVTATAMDGLDPAPIGELVTAVLEQDLSTGSLTVTAFDRAIAGAERLNEALALVQSTGSSGSSINAKTLRWRLVEHGVRNISTLVDGRTEAVANAKEFYAALFSKHGVGALSADVTGLVLSLDSSAGEVTVQPASGQAVMVKLSATTPVALFGERVRSGQLDLASRVTVRYALASGNASRVTVLAGNTMPGDSSLQLALSAGRGEVQGTLVEMGADSATVTILDDATGQRISFLISGSPGAAGAVGLDSFVEGSHVFARYDPASYLLLDLEPASSLDGEELVSGVVQSFIPKIAEGNLTIRTPDGRLRSFTHRAETVIRRDGLRVSINEVRLGVLVRPITRVRTLDTLGGRASEIVALSLKSPEPGLVTGFIRGVSTSPGGEVRVTVSNIWFELISLRIEPNTDISRQGRVLAVQDLTVGQEVTQGSYNPVTLLAGKLDLGPVGAVARASLGR